MDTKTILQKKYLIPVIIFAFILLGIVIPRWFVSDGVQSLRGEEKSFAEYAILRAGNEDFENPFLSLVIQKIQVRSVRKVAGTASCTIYDANGKEITLASSYEADVTALTFFAIPVASTHITCK